jgi:hypothetical protein
MGGDTRSATSALRAGVRRQALGFWSTRKDGRFEASGRRMLSCRKMPVAQTLADACGAPTGLPIPVSGHHDVHAGGNHITLMLGDRTPFYSTGLSCSRNVAAGIRQCRTARLAAFGVGAWVSAMLNPNGPFHDTHEYSGIGRFELGINVRGATLLWSDYDQSGKASTLAVITPALANHLWPTEDLMGKGIAIGGRRGKQQYCRFIGTNPELRDRGPDRPAPDA